MHRFFTSIILVTFIIPVSAQENRADSVLLEQIYEGIPAFEVPRIKDSQFKKVDFGFQAGTSMLMSGRKDALFSSYIAPEVRFHASPRFQVNTGVIYRKGFLPGFGENHFGMADGRFDSFSIYAEGQYHLTERISFSGMVIKDVGITVDPRITAFQKNTGMQSMSLRAQYKITDNMSFGAQIRISDGYRMNPFNPYYGNDPFFRNPSFFAPDPWR